MLENILSQHKREGEFKKLYHMMIDRFVPTLTQYFAPFEKYRGYYVTVVDQREHKSQNSAYRLLHKIYFSRYNLKERILDILRIPFGHGNRQHVISFGVQDQNQDKKTIIVESHLHDPTPLNSLRLLFERFFEKTNYSLEIIQSPRQVHGEYVF